MPDTDTASSSHILSHLQARVEAWPEGFAETLPEDDWMVVNARPRMEKRLVDELRHLGIPGVIFLEDRIHHYPGKGTQINAVPLLGGYVFVHADAGARDRMQRTNRIRHIIDVCDPQGLAADLTALMILIDRHRGPQRRIIMRPELVPGRRVLVASGPFAGFEGIIRRRQGRVHLIVNLHLLGTCVSTTLAARDLELADGQP